MCDNKFYVCEHCGNMVGMINDAGVPMMCCGQKMTKLEAGVVEASREKHIPVVTKDDGFIKVEIGSVAHPMAAEHHIAEGTQIGNPGIIRRSPFPVDLFNKFSR